MGMAIYSYGLLKTVSSLDRDGTLDLPDGLVWPYLVMAMHSYGLDGDGTFDLPDGLAWPYIGMAIYSYGLDMEATFDLPEASSSAGTHRTLYGHNYTGP